MMKRVVEAWGHADLRPLFEVLGDDVIWKSGSTTKIGPFPFGGEYRGRDRVVELLARLSATYNFGSYKAKEIVSSGEVVWGLFEVQGFYAPLDSSEANKPVHFEIAMRWRVKNGKVIESSTYFDTAKLLMQQGQLSLAADSHPPSSDLISEARSAAASPEHSRSPA
jgi:ketosteroid isomerase-like protein